VSGSCGLQARQFSSWTLTCRNHAGAICPECGWYCLAGTKKGIPEKDVIEMAAYVEPKKI